MADKKYINTLMSGEMIEWIDYVRATETQSTGKARSRGDIIRDAVTSLAASYIPAPLTPVTLTKDA